MNGSLFTGALVVRTRYPSSEQRCDCPVYIHSSAVYIRGRGKRDGKIGRYIAEKETAQPSPPPQGFCFDKLYFALANKRPNAQLR